MGKYWNMLTRTLHNILILWSFKSRQEEVDICQSSWRICPKLNFLKQQLILQKVFRDGFPPIFSDSKTWFSAFISSILLAVLPSLSSLDLLQIFPEMTTINFSRSDSLPPPPVVKSQLHKPRDISLNSIQIMNVYDCNGTNIFMRWKMKCSTQRSKVEWNISSFTDWKKFVPLHEWENMHYLFYITCTKIQFFKKI